MSLSEYRITTSLKDYSNTIGLSSTVLGFTSIKSNKGLLKPTYFDTGETNKILDFLGYPKSTAGNVAIQDVIDFNKSYPIYVSAPSGDGGLHGGVLVTKDGSIPLASGLSDTDINDFSEITQEESLGTGNGTTTTFTTTTSLFTYYNNMSIDILVDGVSQDVTATDADPEVLSTTGGDAGTFNRTTGELSYTFFTAPTAGQEITLQYTIDVSSECYFVLLNKGQQADDMAVILTSSGSGTFELELYRQDPDDSTSYNTIGDSPYTVSMVEGTKDGYGQNIYLTNVFDDDGIYLSPIVNPDITFDTFVDDTDYVDFAGGDRGDEVQPSDIVEGFDYLTDIDTYGDVNIVFDTTGETAVASEFETLRGNDVTPGTQGRTKFLMPCSQQSISAILADTATAKFGIDNRGINIFPNPWAKHTDIYNDTPFYCSCMGLIARRYGDSKAGSYGALSPMYISENGIGGELGSSVLELANTATETQLQALNSAGLIGIKKISGLGFTIVGDRTSKSAVLSDYSFTGSSDLADFIIENIESQVLPSMIGKPNDDLHRTNITAQAELVMSGISQYLEDYAILADETNNTAEVRNRREFVLSIAVIFTPNAQTIQFNFVNTRSGTDVSQVINKS